MMPVKHGLYDPAFEKEACGVGFVAHIKGERSHRIILDGQQLLRNMDHRGARGSEANTGDGAGILTALPQQFLARVCREELKIRLPEPGRFGAGIVFLPTLPTERAHCKKVVEQIIHQRGQTCVGWRRVPTEADKADIGPTARASEPHMEQLFVAAGSNLEGEAFERQLYAIRKQASHRLREDNKLQQAKMFYVCSLSTKVMIYKGMLTPHQLALYYPDLAAVDYTSHLAMVHSRFSTNTFPSWDRAQPNRFMCHNGEINTLRGNMNWMRAREGVAKSELFGEDIQKLFPVLEPDCSDSGTFDNQLEFLLMTGRTLQEAIMMMIPEAWQNDEQMPEAKKAFYEYHACLMEPWDGPASIAFTDGHYIGAVLDRNGLRPSRYYLTHDDRVIMASEVGVLPVEPDMVRVKGRLRPGRMFLIDFEEGRLIPDEELKQDFSSRRPYAEWLKRQRISLEDLPVNGEAHGLDPDTVLARMQAFGYTSETLQFMLLPLVQEERDPVGSMGNDSALACLSDKPRMVYDYFKQLFAQVTNPAIDSIREEIIMSLACPIGPEGNLLETTEAQCHRLVVNHPILTNEELTAIRHMNTRGWRSRTIDITYPKIKGKRGIDEALDRICREAEGATDESFSLVILSDRNVGPERVPVSALLACGAVHHHLVRKMKRTRIGIVVETGEAREVHHHCMLIGYGADAINPYLAFEALQMAQRDGLIRQPACHLSGRVADVVAAYRKGVAKGILKVIAKMGISTLQSYKGAQIFEAVGLNEEVIHRCFAGTPSRIQGVGLDTLAAEAIRRHDIGYSSNGNGHLSRLPNPGEFHWRAGGEEHMWDPPTISNLQVSARGGNGDAYREFARHANGEARSRGMLRGLLRFREGANGCPIPLEDVEPASEIVKRFTTAAMSFGSISEETHETLAIGMNRIGARSNTGEGGEDPRRYKPLSNGDSSRSATKQVASGRFGVTIWYLTNSDEMQIKIAQGAKPGEGGELPGRKVDEAIARIRHSTPGVGLISPPPHHDIYSIEDIKQLIHDLKNANPQGQVSVKLVAEMGVGTVAAGVAKAHADHILISGGSGGTGASPLTSIKHAGLPWELGLAETHQTLVLNDLRSRVVLQTDGGLKTGRDVVIAALLGAEEMGFGTAPLIVLGCIMMRKCHLNTCPVGIATRDPELRRKFSGKPEHLINYFFMVAEEARGIMARLGFRTVDEMIGRVDALDMDTTLKGGKAEGLDLSPLLTPARKPREKVEVRCTVKQDHGLEKALDNKLIELARPALKEGKKVTLEVPVVNTNLTVGTMLSHQVVKAWGERGLPSDTIHVRLSGSAGQSFGAFLAGGITLELAGDANDYVGKGLSGGRIIMYPPEGSTFIPEDNIIIGNVVLYGATGGEAFFRGQAAERFCVRNSGAVTVVEGVGDHGCEYMTGGRAVILGPAGRNFAAGMTGGVAYVWDVRGDVRSRCNPGDVELETVDAETDMDELFQMIESHHRYTGSTVARRVLDGWPEILGQFVKVMPKDYKRVLMEGAGKRKKAGAVA